MRAAIGFVLAMALCAQLQAQTCSLNEGDPVKLIRLDGGQPQVVSCHASGTPITINVANETGVVTYAVCDPTIPLSNVGRITVVGELGSEQARVRIVVARDFSAGWSEATLSSRLPGCLDFGGLIVQDEFTRERTAASIFAERDILHAGSDPAALDIDVGRLVWVYCEDELVGNVRAAGTADFSDIQPHDRPVIGRVVGRNQIAGNITAVAGTIVRVAAVHDPLNPPADLTAPALTGDIKALDGRIERVSVSRDIGTPSNSVNIWATRGTWFVRAVESDTSVNSADVTEADFHVDLRANYLGTYPRSGPGDARIKRVETIGDIHGSITAGNIGDDSGFSLAGTRVTGIYAGAAEFGGPVYPGAIYAPITIDYTVVGGIVGAEIAAPVQIGLALNGAVVAWNTDPGSAPVPSVRVGLDVALPAPVGYESIAPGFGGVNCSIPTIDTTEGKVTAYLGCGSSPAYPASIIAARRIESLEIADVTVFNSLWNYNTLEPVIEVSSIGELAIGNFREGLLWSGGLGGNGDYTAVDGDCEIGCIGANAAILVDGFDSLKVDGWVYGMIRVPALPAASVIAVAGGLHEDDPGTLDDNESPLQECLCTVLPEQCTPPPSPDYMTNELAGRPLAVPGRIMIDSALGLAGQIILDAHNDTGLHRVDRWHGAVVVGAASSSPTVLSANPALSSGPALGPMYAALPQTLGGGAIGLVPFGVHRASSDALNQASGGILTSEFNEDPLDNCTSQKAYVDMYGPVELLTPDGSTFGPFLLMHAETGLNNWASAMWWGAEGEVPRTIWMLTKQPYAAPAGDYLYTTQPETVNSHVRCHASWTLEQRVLPVTAADPYVFTIHLDCPLPNGGPYDCTNDDGNACEVPWQLCNDIDFNNDGLFPDNQDLQDYLDVFGGANCPTASCDSLDFNNDGLFPDNLDLQALYRVFAGGECLQ